ncbi:MAG: hypothetical protein A2086_11040 [Spirochaetes bacterium GWD1_27_9]|nr:MAG: hypothetical protein A2Z98_04345 [Spirochaetes bacterium GWB1_27_13]OHD27221.1 MAG: hypothetical protein A2Y34_17060 [Spirochaetes bacterium GWC1_27_15]OHD41226.1 MAG: hypothetical protein A2086_11040 [Spirochaetes bacterium GWD1_27_9]
MIIYNIIELFIKIDNIIIIFVILCCILGNCDYFWIKKRIFAPSQGNAIKLSNFLFFTSPFRDYFVRFSFKMTSPKDLKNSKKT